MIILEKPYVSDFLIDTINKNNICVLDNEIARVYPVFKNLISTKEAVDKYKNENELIYTNSENAISWIDENLHDSKLNEFIKISKDKAKFRNAIKSIYPDYYFCEVSKDELKKLNPQNLKFPLILKPSVGFLSFGVYPVNNIDEWNKVILNLDKDIEKFASVFPENVVNTQKFLIEEMIEGDEFALDAYYDNNGCATILNIYKHPFFDASDVSDRAYYTNKEIIEKYCDKFKLVLDKISSCIGYKNFPFHLELRANENNIIPIELNPMRFCGWCITDMAYSAWGINVYEYFLNQKKPNWENILKDKDNSYYYFTMADIPSMIKNEEIKNIDYEKYLKNISNPLVVRKIDYKNNPVFAIVFAKCDSLDEIKNILKLKMEDFIEI